MKKIIIGYALWAVLGIVLALFGLVSWWVATAFLWLPIGWLVSVLAIGKIVSKIADKFIPKMDEEEAKSSCLHQQSATIVNRTSETPIKCLGEACGKMCPCEFYDRAQ